jgi:glycosyltransferase involved in cell wall biosynthesis
MNILILSNIFPPGFIGGYELGALDVAKGLRVCGHEIHVLTSDYFLDDQEELSSLNVCRSLVCASLSHERAPTDLTRNLYYNFHNIRTLGSAIRRIKPDVVLAFNLHGLGVFSVINYLQKIKMPTILYLMDNIFSGLDLNSFAHKQYEKLFGALEFTDTTRVIAMSKTVSNEVSSALNTELGDVTYIPGWVDFGAREDFPIAARCRGRTRFVFCSRVAPHKGINIVLDAADRLVQHGLTQFSVDVYGAGQVTSFLQQVKAKNLDEQIVYKGLAPKEEMLKILSRYDALVFPTWEREPFGFVASEAAAAGCFPIMTAGIGASEWFLDGYDSLKIFSNDASLCSAMSQVMLWSDEEIKKFRVAALRTGRKNFSFERWLPVIQKACFDVSANKSKRDLFDTTRGVESAFLFLSSLLRESLN